MIECKKGKVNISGNAVEIMADMATIMTVVYKMLQNAGMQKETVNAVTTDTLFMAVSKAQEGEAE